MEKLSQYSKPYRVKIFIGSFAKFVEAMLELYVPFLMAQILDIGIVGSDKKLITITAIKIAVMVLFGFLCSTICQYIASDVSQKIATTIRYDLMNYVSNYSYSDLDSVGTSGIINRLTVDLNNYQYMLVMVMRMVVRGPAIGIGAVIMSLFIDIRLSLVFVILIPILAVMIMGFMKYTAPLFKIAQNKLDDFTLIVRENLSGVRVIRAFANANQEQNKADKSAEDAGNAYLKVGSIFSSMNPINSILLNAAIIVILFLGAQKVNQGEIAPGNILSLTIYANKVLYALVAVANLMLIIAKGKISGKRISEIFKITPSMNFPSFSQEPKQGKDYIAVDDISFSYAGSGEILKKVSFQVNKGETIGVVGVTGAGKTTLINLIQRFYDIDSGEILLDGINILDYSKNDIRKKIGVVPQSKALFSGTISDNVRMGKPEATKDEIVQALKTAQCLEFVNNMPQNINSEIVQGGKNLSGGQQQRLTIARALVKRPELLILDDCLSALDYKTDFNLRNSLKQDLPDSTIVIISQRISSVMSADKIIVLDKGKLVGFDNHNNLLRDCGIYNQIYSSQQSSDTVVEVSNE